MQVHVHPYGVLKEWLGPQALSVELPEGATVAKLWEILRAMEPGRAPEQLLPSIAVGVNGEYAQATQRLADGDEVALLPPVSGGSARSDKPTDEELERLNVVVALTHDPIDTQKLIDGTRSGEDGAVVVFDGMVRNHSRGRRTLFLEYEAYDEMAVRQMEELGRKARERFGVRQVTIAHRLGRLEIGETSVVIVAASAHRTAAFEACRWLIDTLKQTVPIWKKETFADGAVWAPGEPFPEGFSIGGVEAKHEA